MCPTAQMSYRAPSSSCCKARKETCTRSPLSTMSKTSSLSKSSTLILCLSPAAYVSSSLVSSSSHLSLATSCVFSYRPSQSHVDCCLFSYLYQFQKLGDDDNEPEFSSTDYPSFGMADPSSPLPRAYFKPRPLDNLTLVDEQESLDPIIDSKVMKLLPNSDTPQIFAACGRGARSTFRTLRHGLDVEEVVSSDLPGIPNAVWTTKLKEEGVFNS